MPRIAFESHEASALGSVLGSLNPFAKYRHDPIAYAKEVHNVTLYPEQAQVLNALVNGSHRVMCRSGNGVGKTLIGAVAAKWAYDVFDICEVIITGAREESLKDSAFKEIRLLHGKAPGLFPASMRIESGPGHYIKGTVAKDHTSFQSAHSKNCMIIFEEAVGIPPDIWEAARGILATGVNTWWLCIFNPTDTSSQAWYEEQTNDWEVFAISTLQHPNIKSQLAGGPVIIDSGPTLASLENNMKSMGSWIREEEKTLSDIVLQEKDKEPRYWRPGPVGDARILGRWPTQSSYSIFAESDFSVAQSHTTEADALIADLLSKAKNPKFPNIGSPNRFGNDLVITFSSDVARFGDDNSTIWGRIGKTIFHYETYNGQSTEHTTGRLKALCQEWGEKLGITPTKIPCKIDDVGIGGAVIDQRGAHNFQPVNAAERAIEDLSYDRKRSEMLFNLATRMREGSVRFSSAIDPKVIQTLKRQALSVTYKMDSFGRRVAESKDSIKERIKRSPDDLDALAILYYGPSGWTEPKEIKIERPTGLLRDNNRQLFGR